MRIGIDASNIRGGGGLVHLIGLLEYFDPQNTDVEKIVIWSSDETLNRLPDRSFLKKSHQLLLNKSLIYQIYWQLFRLTKESKEECDVLLILGGHYLGSFRPFAVMARNLLPFDKEAMKKHSSLHFRIKLKILKRLFIHTFSRADKVIYVSKFARDYIAPHLKTGLQNSSIIEHGINRAFFNENNRNKPTEKIFNLLSVSNVSQYKGFYNLVLAVFRIWEEGGRIDLRIVGHGHDDKLAALIDTVDPEKKFIHLMGGHEHSDMPEFYFSADGFIFPSFCEAFGFPIYEAIAAGLPVKCSNRIDVPVLSDGKYFFDPERVDDIVRAIKEMMGEDKAISYCDKAEFMERYNWEKTAKKTFDILCGLNGYMPNENEIPKEFLLPSSYTGVRSLSSSEMEEC